MAEFSILELEGASALNRALETLPLRVQTRVLASAVGKAATPVVRAVRAGTPKGRTGNLKKSVKKIVRKRAKRGPMAVVGHTWPSGAHAHLVEKGTKPRTQRTTGRFVGAMPAQPYLVPAFRQVQSTAEMKLRQYIGEGIQKEAAKLAKKAK